MASNSQTERPIIERRSSKDKRSENRGVIQPRILLRMAYKNLFFKKLRTTLTLLGVIIGIGSIVFLLSFGFGLQNLVSEQVVGSNSVQTIDVSTLRSKVVKLNQENISRISDINGVTEVAKSYNTAGRIKLKGSQTESVVYGVNSGFIELSTLEFKGGESFAKGKTNQVLISTSLAKAIGITNYDNLDRQKINLSFDALVGDSGDKKVVTKDFQVRGVFTGEAQAEAFIDASQFENAGVKDATQLKVVVPNKDEISNVRKTIEGLGFTTTSPLDTVEQINQFFTLFRYVLVGFGGIGMIVAILGMFNTLTISLLERTREIGLMISLGARKQDIRRMFVTEALFLSMLGGLMGIIGAVILGFIGNLILNSFAHSNGVKGTVSAFTISPTLALVILGLSGLVGLVVVYFPAQRASQTDPIEALHND